MQDTDREILRLANAHYRFEAHRLQAARERFDLSPVRFYQAVNRLLDDADAIASCPALVMPLRRVREQQGRLKRAG